MWRWFLYDYNLILKWTLSPLSKWLNPTREGELRQINRRKVTDVDFSSLPWEHPGCLKRSTRVHFGGGFDFPQNKFWAISGRFERERETGLNSAGTCPRAREKRRPGVKSILFKADSNFFSDWMQSNTNSLLYLHAFEDSWWKKVAIIIALIKRTLWFQN